MRGSGGVNDVNHYTNQKFALTHTREQKKMKGKGIAAKGPGDGTGFRGRGTTAHIANLMAGN